MEGNDPSLVRPSVARLRIVASLRSQSPKHLITMEEIGDHDQPNTQVTRHVAQKAKGSAINWADDTAPRLRCQLAGAQAGGKIFGCLKTVGPMRKLYHRGTALVDWMFVFSCAVYNLVRIRNLTVAA